MSRFFRMSQPDPYQMLQHLGQQSIPPGYSPWGSQRPAGNDKAKFMPSKSLREHIVERLRLQQDCLTSLSERIDVLEELAGTAPINGNGPGDEQIDGEKIAQIKRQSAIMCEGGTSAAASAMMERDLKNPGGTLYGWSRAARLGRRSPYLSNLQNILDDAEEDKLDEDPLQEYLRLENEIRMLANMGTVPNKSSSNPYQAQADQWEDMIHPHKALAKRLPEILGPGNGGGGSAKSIKSPQVNMTTPAMPQMQPQMQPQMYPNQNNG